MRALACLIGSLLAACTTAASAIPSTPVPVTAAPGASAASVSPTPMAQTATELLECDGAVSPAGGRADEFGPPGGATADETITLFLANPLFPIPRAGYTHLGIVGDRSVYAFDRDNEVKVVVVVSRRFGELAGTPFAVEEVRMCDPAEMGPADFGPGLRAWVHETTESLLFDVVGSGHCEWQSARLLHVEIDGTLTKQYLRDPEGVFDPARQLDTYAEDVELPADASDSGYRSPEGFELWFTTSDRAAYVVTPDGVERWPRAHEPHGCT